jgi:hypothetical protein
VTKTAARVRDILDAIDKVSALIAEQQQVIDLVLDQLAESQLRIRYLMETFKYDDPHGLILGGQPPRKRSLYEIYASGDRERFLVKLAEVERARQSPPSDGGAEGGVQAPSPSRRAGSASSLTSTKH